MHETNIFLLPFFRTEYVDSEVEFVLENLDISSFNILPGHIYIRNITDVDITATADATQTSVGTLTNIKLQAMQLTLKDVSFFYKDKTASVGPTEYTGLLAFKLPEKGIDVDIKVRLLPNTPEGLTQREKRKAYHFVERVEVNVAEDITLDVKQSNHGILLSVFKPILTSRFRDTLAKVLAENIRGLLEGADSLAWDVGRRAEVFEDTGLSSGASLAAAFWSEIGRMRRMQGGGILGGWDVTGTGFMKNVPGAGSEGGKIAMGAEPQILDGDKKGPLGTNSQTVEERLPEVPVPGGMDVDGAVDSAQDAAQAASETAGEVKEQAKSLVEQGKQQVDTFKRTVEVKSAEEKRRDGWKSPAFDFN